MTGDKIIKSSLIQLLFHKYEKKRKLLMKVKVKYWPRLNVHLGNMLNGLYMN